MNRDKAREMTMQIIFQMDMHGSFDYNKLNLIEENNKVFKSKQAIHTLLAIKDNINKIDSLIDDNLDNWTLDRIGKVELAILRTAVAEILYCEEIPTSVSINEAVNLARKYADNRSYAFVNAILAKITKE